MHHTQISTSMGVKISAPGLEDAVAGTQLLAAWLQLLGMMGCKHRITSRVFFFCEIDSSKTSDCFPNRDPWIVRWLALMMTLKSSRTK